MIFILLILFINTKVFTTYKFFSKQSGKVNLYIKNNHRNIVSKENIVNELDLLRSRSKLLENIITRLKQHVSNVENNLQNEVLLKKVRYARICSNDI